MKFRLGIFLLVLSIYSYACAHVEPIGMGSAGGLFQLVSNYMAQQQSLGSGAHSILPSGVSSQEAFFAALLAAGKGAEQPQDYELAQGRADGKSNILLINGVRDFAWLLEQSKKQPVVVKVFADKSPDSQKAAEAYQKVAHDTKDAIFVAMDIFGRRGQKSQNFHLITRIMFMAGFNSISLPTFIFLRNGRLVHDKAVLQGYKSEDDLKNSIIESLAFSKK